jgi:hypothetical protein
MRQRSAEPIELPDDEHVAGLHERQRLDQPRPIVLRAGGVIFEQVPAVNACRQQRVALQIRGLSIRLGRDAHVPDQHRRKTPKLRFPYDRLRRHGFPYIVLAVADRFSVAATDLSENKCFPTGDNSTDVHWIATSSSSCSGLAAVWTATRVSTN